MMQNIDFSENFQGNVIFCPILYRNKVRNHMISFQPWKEDIICCHFVHDWYKSYGYSVNYNAKYIFFRDFWREMSYFVLYSTEKRSVTVWFLFRSGERLLFPLNMYIKNTKVMVTYFAIMQNKKFSEIFRGKCHILANIK